MRSQSSERPHAGKGGWAEEHLVQSETSMSLTFVYKTKLPSWLMAISQSLVYYQTVQNLSPNEAKVNIDVVYLYMYITMYYFFVCLFFYIRIGLHDLYVEIYINTFKNTETSFMNT